MQVLRVEDVSGNGSALGPVELRTTAAMRHLRWLAVVLPVSFLTLLWLALHTVFPNLHRFPDILAVLGITILGVAAFAFAVFELVKRLELRIVAQNRELGSLLTVGRAVSCSLQLGELLDAAMDAILRVLPAELIEVWLREGEGSLRLARLCGVSGQAYAAAQTSSFDEVLPGLRPAQQTPDDYLVKPFSPRKLVARIKAILRRSAEAEMPLVEQLRAFRAPLATPPTSPARSTSSKAGAGAPARSPTWGAWPGSSATTRAALPRDAV